MDWRWERVSGLLACLCGRLHAPVCALGKLIRSKEAASKTESQHRNAVCGPCVLELSFSKCVTFPMTLVCQSCTVVPFPVRT